MKYRWIALSLGMGLMACQPLPTQPAQNKALNTRMPAPKEAAQLSARLSSQKTSENSHRLQVTVYLNSAFKTQAINCNANSEEGPLSQIAHLKISIYGPGIESPLMPVEADGNGNVGAEGCQTFSTVSFSDVPEGALRFLKVQGLAADGTTEVAGADIRRAFKLENNALLNIGANFSTRPTAAVLEHILATLTPPQRAIHLASRINLQKLQNFMDALSDDGEFHPSLFNIPAIANWLINQPENLTDAELNSALEDLTADTESHPIYRLGSDTVSGIIVGAQREESIRVRYNDASSAELVLSPGMVSSSEVAFSVGPTATSGTYLLEAIQSNGSSYIHATLNNVSPGTNYILNLASEITDNWFEGGAGETPEGGKITALVRYDADKIYAGLENGGVYRLEDSQWQRVSGILHSQQVRALAVAPDENKVYTATNQGIYVSYNQGDWQLLYSTSTHPGIVINDLFVDPQTQTHIYAATNQGLLRSTNAGSSFGLQAPSDALVRIIKYTPANLGDARFFALSSPSNNRIFRSADGVNWDVFYQEPSHNLIDIAVNADATLLAIASSDSGTPYVRYTNNPLSTGLPISTPPNYGFPSIPFGSAFPGTEISRLHFKDDASGQLYVATKNDGVKYATGPSGTWESHNSTPPINQPHVTSLIDGFPALIAGTLGGGVSELSDDMQTLPINEGLSGQYITALARHPSSTQVMAAATRGGGVFLSVNGGETWQAHHDGLYNNPRERQVTSLTFDHHGHLYAGTAGGGIHVLYSPEDCLNTGGWEWHKIALPDESSARVQALAAADGKVFAGLATEGPLSAQGLYSNQEAEFDSALCTAGLITPGAWTGPQISGDIFSLAVKPQGETGQWVILAGHGNGQIYRSLDSGDSWGSPVASGFSQPIVQIAASPDIPGYIYAAAYAVRGVSASEDSGASWSAVGQELPGDALVKSLTVFRKNSNRVMVGLENGRIFYNDTARFANSPWIARYPEDLRLPVTALLANDESDPPRLLAGTLGRSVLKMDLSSGSGY